MPLSLSVTDRDTQHTSDEYDEREGEVLDFDVDARYALRYCPLVSQSSGD